MTPRRCGILKVYFSNSVHIIIAWALTVNTTGSHQWEINIVSGHYLNQCPRSMSPYGVTGQQWVNINNEKYQPGREPGPWWKPICTEGLPYWGLNGTPKQIIGQHFQTHFADIKFGFFFWQAITLSNDNSDHQFIYVPTDLTVVIGWCMEIHCEE